VIEIERPGNLALIQDLGRPAFTHLGVGRCGAFDSASHRLANRLVGNEERAATIEILLGGLQFRLRQAATIALTGASCALTSARRVDWNAPLTLPAGTRLRLGTPNTGLRSYLAVRGGFDVAETLGSRSADSLSGLGPPPLEQGDQLAIGELIEGDPVEVPAATPSASRPIAVLPGPRADWFSRAAVKLLSSATWTVAATSNRVGVRLSGPALERTNAEELPSEPTLPGAIQVPPDGQPIILGPDAPVTGGYPVIAVVTSAELHRLGQARPGDSIRLAGYAN
jgi:biotin-dependent carboxylase-like uncharacterized protein